MKDDLGFLESTVNEINAERKLVGLCIAMVDIAEKFNFDEVTVEHGYFEVVCRRRSGVRMLPWHKRALAFLARKLWLKRG